MVHVAALRRASARNRSENKGGREDKSTAHGNGRYQKHATYRLPVGLSVLELECEPEQVAVGTKQPKKLERTGEAREMA